jgi:para-nitrobenzyl esterase
MRAPSRSGRLAVCTSLALAALTGCGRGTTPLAALDAGAADAASDDATPHDADVGADDAGARPDAADVGLGVDASVAQTGVELVLPEGTVRGVRDGALRVWKGIPFAAAPVGERRFAPPRPVAPWRGVVDARDYGPSCPQQDLGPEWLLGGFAGPQSEDCLSLNVWAFDDARVRPVMVFIYGGGFVAGSSAWPLYEADRLARAGDVVVVTFNYRLGALGFLTTDALAAASPDGAAGNYGLLDQLAALRWVRDHIAKVGGDPGNVTIFGESAGAISVCALLGAPAADGLFHRAIMQSGMCTLPLAREAGPLGLPPSRVAGQRLVADVGCAGARDEVECLRALPADALVRASRLTSIFTGDVAALAATSPHVDGVWLREQPLERLRRGEADVPFLAGSNADEGLLFAASAVVATRAQLRRAIAGYVGDALAEPVADLDEARAFPLPSDAWIAFLGEVTFICPGLAAARAALGGRPSFTYHFTRAPLLTRPVGVAHGIELFYVFGTFERVGLRPSAADARVIETVQTAWARFAWTGEPYARTGWPRLDPARTPVAILDDPSRVDEEIRGGRCAALTRLGVLP